MKTKRELELEIELYSTREQLLKAHYEIMMRDGETNSGLLHEARIELEKMNVSGEDKKDTAEQEGQTFDAGKNHGVASETTDKAAVTG